MIEVGKKDPDPGHEVDFARNSAPANRLWPRGLRLFHHELGRGNLQGLGDVEQPLVKQASSAKFYVNQHVARDARPECRSLLREAALGAERSDSLSNFTAAKFPRGDTFRVVLTGSRRHLSQ